MRIGITTRDYLKKRLEGVRRYFNRLAALKKELRGRWWEGALEYAGEELDHLQTLWDHLYGTRTKQKSRRKRFGKRPRGGNRR